jgi:hypothetical protein
MHNISLACFCLTHEQVHPAQMGGLRPQAHADLSVGFAFENASDGHTLEVEMRNKCIFGCRH